MSISSLFSAIEKIINHQSNQENISEQSLTQTKKKELLSFLTKSLHEQRTINKYIPSTFLITSSTASFLLLLSNILPQVLIATLSCWIFLCILSLVIKKEVLNFKKFQSDITKTNLRQMTKKAKFNDTLPTIVLLSHCVQNSDDTTIIKNLIDHIQNKDLLSENFKKIASLATQEIKSKNYLSSFDLKDVPFSHVLLSDFIKEENRENEKKNEKKKLQFVI